MRLRAVGARTLLEGVLDLGDGAAFEDARGAIWLPGTPAGQGPLRRRAELTALRESRQAAFSDRESVASAATATRAALADAQVRAAAAAESAAAAEQPPGSPMNIAPNAHDSLSACAASSDRTKS